VRLRTRIAWFALGCILPCVQAAPVGAHAMLVESDPADGAVVSAPPPTLSLVFSEPVSVSVLRLVRPGGGEDVLPKPAGPSPRVEVSIPSTGLRGTYVLSWRVVSLDSHPVGGTVAFSVGEPGNAAASRLESANTPQVAILWFAKLIMYVGLLFGVGGCFFLRSRKAQRQFLLAASAAGGLATVSAVGLQGLDVLGAPLTGLLDPATWQSSVESAFGATAIVALAA
jgi:copper transport protein